MNCPKCKLQNLPGCNFCEKCGTDLKKAAQMASQPTPVAPYGNYSSTPPRAYSPPARPTPAPRPTPATRPTPSPSPSPSQQSAPQPMPVQEAPRRSPVRSAPQPSAPDPAPAPPSPVLEPLPFALLVDSQGREFPLRYDESLIGRASPGEGINPAVDLTAIDQTGSVSRRHAKIGKDDSSIFVEELGSSNGSRHNGQSLRVGMQTPLSDGDALIFGSLPFTFKLNS